MQFKFKINVIATIGALICGLLSAVPANATESTLADASQTQTTAELAHQKSITQTPDSLPQPLGTGDYDLFCSEPTFRPIADTNSCLGTVTAYISGNFAWEVNRLSLLATAPGDRTSENLNAWCSAHSFECSFAFFTASAIFTVLYGILTGGSTSRVAPDATINVKAPDAMISYGAAIGQLSV